MELKTGETARTLSALERRTRAGLASTPVNIFVCWVFIVSNTLHFLLIPEHRNIWYQAAVFIWLAVLALHHWLRNSYRHTLAKIEATKRWDNA